MVCTGCGNRNAEKDREQKSKLPGVILSEDTRFTTDLKAAVEGKDLLVLAVPSRLQEAPPPGLRML